jgi:hypothetical protein
MILSNLRNFIEDTILTSPYFGESPLLRSDNPLISANLKCLKKNGYCSVGKLLSEDELFQIRNKITSLSKNSKVANFNKAVNYIQFNKPLLIHPAFTKIATNPYILDLVEGYFNRKSYLADVDARRIYAFDLNEIEKRIGYSSSNWHRDTRGRQLKLMIYLTDVNSNDSNFSFIPKTHIPFIPLPFIHRSKYRVSRFSDNDKLENESLEWLGKAGHAYLFDTNLIHRLRRKKTASVRDSFTFYFTPGQELRHLDLDLALPELNKNKIFSEPENILFRPRIKY